MSYDTSTSPSAGNATKVSEYARLRDAIKAVAQLRHFLGGGLDLFVEDTSAVDLPNGFELEIDGTNLAGLSVYLEVNGMCKVTAAVTITFELYNVTTAAIVSSSSVTISASNAFERKWNKSSTLTLATGVNRYKARIKGSTGAANMVSGCAWVSIRG